MKAHRVVSDILRWYGHAARPLPWRSTRDPYRILLSEIMLQQTQVSRVLQTYPRFLKLFPDVRALARSSQRRVVIAWQGMGYNNRAIRLHRMAKVLVARHRGRIPRDAASLQLLPGIGPYTANALLAFAFRRAVPAVDVNVRRVLSRIFFPMRHAFDLQPEADIWHLAGRILPERRVWAWNQALMDLGATVCRARRPACAQCPVARACSSRASMTRPGRRTAARERTFYGIPHRIYRGRIIQTLRERGAVGAFDLGRRICPHFTVRNATWLATLLEGLQRDGLIRLRGGRSLQGMSVGLA